MSDSLNFARALIGQGVGMGWGDEAEAWLRSRITGRPYEGERARINQEYNRFQERNPYLAPIAEFAGGVLPAVGAYMAVPFTGGAAAPAAVAGTARTAGALGTIASRLAGNTAARVGAGAATGAATGVGINDQMDEGTAIDAAALGTLGALTGGQAPRIGRMLATPYGRGATVGAIEGGIAGAGGAEPGSRVEGGTVGAGIGAPMGAAVPAVMRSGNAVQRWLSERMSPSPAAIERGAAERVNRALNEAGMQPSDIPTRLASDRAMGVPSVVANVDPALVDLAETVAQRSGPSGRRVEAALGEQRGGARERVYRQTEEGLRPNLQPNNFFDQQDALVQSLRTRAAPAYQAAYDVGEVYDPYILRLLELPEYRGAWNTARQLAASDASNAEAQVIADEARGIFGAPFNPNNYRLQEIYRVAGKNPDTGEDILELAQTVPDVRTLDYMKRALDAQVRAGFQQPGNAVASTNARSLAGLRDVLRDRTKDLVPEYRRALDEYRGESEVLDALRSGMDDFGRLKHEEIGRLFGAGPEALSAAEREAFRTGAARNIYGTIMNPSGNFNSAQRLIGSPETRQKLEAMFDSPAQYGLFQAALEREAQLFQQSNRILAGSPTARRTQARERFDEGPDVGGAVAEMATGGWGASLANMALRAFRGAAVSDDIADRTARMLMSSDPAEVAAAVRVLENASERAAQGERRLSLGEAGVIGGTAAGVIPEPYTE
jgi:uncharacterized protein YciW